jgi:HEAT repeat protein
MDCGRFFIFAVILFGIGCSAQPRFGYQSAVGGQKPVVGKEEEQLTPNVPSPTADDRRPPTVNPQPAVETPKPIVADKRQENTPPTNDYETILSQDLWVKNVILDRTGKTNQGQSASSSDSNRKRWNDIKQLNMTNKERRMLHNDKLVYETEVTSSWRWFHREIEKINQAPSENRTIVSELLLFLQDKKYRDKKYKVLRANTAIYLGRENAELDGLDELLFKIVQEQSLRTELRCAAAETLGKRNVSAEDIIDLIDDYKEKQIETVDKKTGQTVKKTQAGIAQLWVELLCAAAEKIKPWEHPCFLEPFSARDYDTRLQTAKLWRRCSEQENVLTGSLPKKFLDLVRQEPSSAIRTEMIRTLGVWREPRILEAVKEDLHRETLVRNAALDALAEADCQEAVPLIEEKLNDTVPFNRMKAVQTLAKLERLEKVKALTNDPDEKVRNEVNKVLGIDPATAKEKTVAKEKQNEKQNEKHVKTSAVEYSVEDLLTFAENLDSEKSSLVSESCEHITDILKELDGEAVQQNKATLAKLKEVLSYLRKANLRPRQEADIAAILHILNEPAGAETLRRLANSGDVQTKCYVAKKIGDLEDPLFLPVLIPFLDNGNGSVRQAALTALPKIADLPKTDGNETTQQKIARWKRFVNEE